MKKTAFILFVAMLLASCDSNISPEIANAFKGEYWMKTITTTYYSSNGSIESTSAESWSPVSIYEENGKLYVLTDNYGRPDTDTTSGASHGYILNYTDHPNYVGARCRTGVKEDDEGGIENVEVIGDPIVFLRNGMIWTVWKGIYFKSLPIKVHSGSETVLNLEPYDKVDVQLTTAEGEILQTIKAWYEYGPMVKDGDVIKWEVEYKDDYVRPSNQDAEYDRVIHKNTLYKR